MNDPNFVRDNKIKTELSLKRNHEPEPTMMNESNISMGTPDRIDQDINRVSKEIEEIERQGDNKDQENSEIFSESFSVHTIANRDDQAPNQNSVSTPKSSNSAVQKRAPTFKKPKEEPSNPIIETVTIDLKKSKK